MQRNSFSKMLSGLPQSCGGVSLEMLLAHYLRKKILSLEQSQEFILEAMNLLQGREYEVASFQALSLVSSCDCSAYACEFVALAQDLEAPLITVDKKILSEFPSLAFDLVEYVS